MKFAAIERLLCLLTVYLTVLMPPASAAIYDYLAAPDSSETFDPSPLRIYLPDTIETIRGIYFCVDPQNSDSRYIVENAAMLELVTAEGFALMGARLSNVDMASGIGAGILRGLNVFAQLAARPELTYTNIYFEGYSWGGQFSYHFTKWRPDRVVGFITQKGGYHDTAPAGDAIAVPGYMFIGELDLPYRIENLTGIFEAHRPLGAVWALAMQPGAAHERITDRKLLDPFFREVVAARIPLEIPPTSPVHLLTVDESSGWLGNRATFAIGIFDCYNDNIALASWLAKRPLCVSWQAFVSSGTVTDTIPCLSAVESDPFDQETNVRANTNRSLTLVCSPNPFNAELEIRFNLPRSERIVVEVYDISGRLMRTLSNDILPAGVHRLHWNGENDTGRSVSPGLYLIRLISDTETDARAVRTLYYK